MEIINKYGVDVVRWYFYTINPPAEPKKFDEADAVRKQIETKGYVLEDTSSGPVIVPQ